ncbi:hypothetical protein B0J14DRAFT_13977 [Halenospora varia]|nr:hypothetical protein B0J14DRAFT_13977 [Halenospora varia]
MEGCSSNKALQQFTLFPFLPLDLRLMIWEYSINQTRIVELCQSLEGRGPDDWKPGDSEYNENPFYSPTTIPTILHTNQESRAFGLTYYTLSFPRCSEPPRIYFCTKFDTLFLPGWCFADRHRNWEDQTSQLCRSKIRRLAVEFDGWCGRWKAGTLTTGGELSLKDYPNLEEVTIVLRKNDISQGITFHVFKKIEPELGQVEFQNLGPNEESPYEEEDYRRTDFLWEGFGVEQDSDKPMTVSQTIVRYVELSFEDSCKEMIAKNESWKRPLLRVVGLRRDGVRMLGGFTYQDWDEGT